MKTTLLYTMAIMLSFFCSCDENRTVIETEPDGYQGNTIKLSNTELNFSSHSSIKEVTTEGEQWVMSIITTNDYYFMDNIVVTTGDIGKFENTPLKIEGDWFIITRELKKIIVEVKSNEINQNRIVKIEVNDRNYFDQVTVTQAGN